LNPVRIQEELVKFLCLFYTKVVLRDDRLHLVAIALANAWMVPVAETLPRKIQCFAGITQNNTNEFLLHLTLGDFYFLFKFDKFKMLSISFWICGKIHEFISKNLIVDFNKIILKQQQ
jgi:hypothetical protein